MPNNEEEFLEENGGFEETPEIQEQNEPVQEEPASIGSTIKESGEAIKKTAINKAKAEVSKKALALLTKHPVVLGIIVIILVFLIFLITLIALDFDFSGRGNTSQETYSVSCDKVYLTWENEDYIEAQKEAGTYVKATNPTNVDLSDTERYSYKTYDYDTFVTGIVWNDNQAAGDLNNDIIYTAMAIAARSRVIASLGDNCVVLRDAEDKENFVELTGDEDKYSEIKSAVTNTSGLIIGRDEEVLNAKYDAFSYIKKSKTWSEDDTSKGSYYMMNKNKSGQQILPALWVDKNVKSQKQKVLNSTYLESMSLYGAKYLLEKTDSQYDLYRVLQYYYGKDIEYYYIGNANANYKCSQIDFAKTSLTREEFISLVTVYLQDKTSQTAKLFTENAGTIYDLGLEVGANPEMVYIIAEKEQGWKDTEFTLASYNFYGYAVYNGADSGKYFDSFEDGVETILEYVKEKGTLDAFTKVYSYLGTYLANPGSWGDGGCIYLKLPEIYGPDYSRCDPSYKCASSNGGPGCVETTEAEKQAYIDWQASKILVIRKNIFLLDADACGYEGSTEGTTFLNESISTFLSNNGTTLDEFNNKVLAQGCKYQGTGTGVAGVAATAVSELAAYGKKFHYQWGGMHTSAAPSSYGVPSNWGPSGTGPDCSGFVSWALYNAGFNWRSLGATDWGKTGEVVNLGDERIQVGDFIVTPGNRGYNHIVIITAINNDNYHVVEAASTNTGVVFNQINMNDSKRKAVLMSDYYATAAKSSTFSSMCTTKGLS